MPDDRGVHQQVQRLGGERPERGQREAAGSRGRRPSGAPRATLRCAACRPGRRRSPAPAPACGLRGAAATAATPLAVGLHARPARSSAALRARAGPVAPARRHRACRTASRDAPRRRRAAERRARPHGASPTTCAPAAERGDAGGGAAARLPDRRRAPRRRAHQRRRRRARSAGSSRASARRAAAARAGAALRSAGCAAGEAQRVKLRLYHHRDGARVAYREAGTGPGARAAALGGAQPPRVRARRRAPRRPLPARAARPPAARRLRGPPAPPLHARLAGRGDGRRSAARRSGRGRSSAATTLGAELLLRAVDDRAAAPARLVLMPNRLHRPRERAGAAARVADGGARRARCPASTACSPTARGASFRPGARAAALGARQPGGARPRPPRVRRRRRQREPRALVGEASRAAGRVGAAAASCSTPTRGIDRADAAAVGRRGPRCTRSQAAEEALDLLPDGAAARARRAPAS